DGEVVRKDKGGKRLEAGVGTCGTGGLPLFRRCALVNILWALRSWRAVLNAQLPVIVRERVLVSTVDAVIFPELHVRETLRSHFEIRNHWKNCRRHFGHRISSLYWSLRMHQTGWSEGRADIQDVVQLHQGGEGVVGENVLPLLRIGEEIRDGFEIGSQHILRWWGNLDARRTRV